MATFGQRCKGFGMRSFALQSWGAHRCCRTPIHWFCQDPWFDSISRKTHWNVAGCTVSLMNRRFLERLVMYISIASYSTVSKLLVWDISRKCRRENKSLLTPTFDLFTRGFKRCMLLPWGHLPRRYENCERNGPISIAAVSGQGRQQKPIPWPTPTYRVSCYLWEGPSRCLHISGFA